MIKLALCDDEAEQREAVGKLLREYAAARPSLARGAKSPKTPSQKVKVGLTIDESLVDAVDDYIYHARKQGRRLKKNSVYETALRRFLEAEGIDVR